MDMDYSLGFWIKFGIVSLVFAVPIFMMAPTLKWKLIFTFAVPVGVFIALAGKSIRIHN